MAKPERHRWQSIPAEQVFPGITRQVIDSDRQTIVRYVYAPGSLFPVHSHPEEQMTAILSGRITFQVGDEAIKLGPGEVAIIPPDVPHGASVTGDETVETLNTMTPRRLTNPFGQG